MATDQDTGEGDAKSGAARERQLFEEALREAREIHRSRSGSPRAASAGGAPLPDDASFPGYDVLRFVHRGGQGSVFEAVHRASRRRVAIKVLLDGAFASDGERARFEREIDLLSRIRHPGIVAIHDSGEAPGGSFHVMEFVDGVPLDVWSRDPARDLQAHLRLFIRICDAVNAAHLRGVIHRDLKPANILVDAEGNPHILDFGLAREHGGHGALDAAVTITGQFVGSLPWASPEQVEGSAHDLDLRSDVYTLGVLLHQMLTDEFPYPVTGRIRDVIHNITLTAPTPLNAIRMRRGAAAVDQDIEAIVARCLHKDRERRYQTAGEVAREIERFLSGAPIDARGDSGWYLLRKAVRRHRVAVATVAAFVALLATSTVTMAVLVREARAAETRAKDDRDLANAAALRAAASVDMLHGLIENVDPMNEIRDISAYLEAAEATTAAHWKDEPWAQARLRYAIAVAYESTYIKNPRSAILGLARQFEAIDALELPDTNEARRILFLLQHHRNTLAAVVFGPQTVTADAARVAREATDHPALNITEILGTKVAYANLLNVSGRPAEAVPLYRDVYEEARESLGEESMPALICRQRMLGAMAQIGDCEEAIQEIEDWRTASKSKQTYAGKEEYRVALWTAVMVFTHCSREAEQAQALAEHEAASREFRAGIEVELAQIQKGR